MKKSPQAKPSHIKLTSGHYYFWCQCGQSSRSPLCDGSHDGALIRPLVFKVDETAMHTLCGCTRTQTPPFCDGSHGRE
jgi:CDGSH-type Zn-finger protein